MFRLVPVFLLLSCVQSRLFKKDYVTLSESPCVDGTILNIDQAGCKNYYWGTDPEMITLKIRCTYPQEETFWTTSSFYAVPLSHEVVHSNWHQHCIDRYVKMYSSTPGIELEIEGAKE